MITRNLRFAAAILGVAILLAFVSLYGMHERIQKLSEGPASEEQARREVLAPPISTPSDLRERATIFWADGEELRAVQVELQLSAEPVQRSKQVLEDLIANPPTAEQRTLPADTTLLGFYILPDGTAIADFSDALVTQVPSGIASETMAINSISQTLEANVPSLHRLKILIHGQEAETLAGHVDLSGFFDLNPTAPQAAPSQHALSSAAPKEEAAESNAPQS